MARIVGLCTLTILLYGTFSVMAELNFLDESQALAYLQNYGYMEKENLALTSRFHSEDDPREKALNKAALKNAIKDFQYNFALEENGEFTSYTKTEMQRPRCGFEDFKRNRSARHKRYLVKGPKWTKTHLTWSLRSTKSNPEVIRQDLHEAFQVWQDQTVFTFQEVYENNADIVVEFFRLEHGDGGAFDGPGRTLAHAFYPDSGEVHFDDDETWVFGTHINTTRTRKWTSFFDAAVHEIGHALGLGHSNIKKSIMFPSMAHDKRYFKLTDDDVAGMEEIYGTVPIILQDTPNTSRVTERPRTKPTSNIPDCCNTSYDAITIIKDDVFIFKGQYVWRIASTGVMLGYPVEIRRMWRDLPIDMTKVDAVYEKRDGSIVIFVGKNFWRFEGNKKLQSGKLVDLGLSPDVDNIDAIFIWGRTSETFIFKGLEYWRFNEMTQKVSEGYPKPTTLVWKNVGYFDTAFQKEEKTYFFKGLDFFEFDNKFLKFSERSESSAKRWMMCPDREPNKRIYNLDSKGLPQWI